MKYELFYFNIFSTSIHSIGVLPLLAGYILMTGCKTPFHGVMSEWAVQDHLIKDWITLTLHNSTRWIALSIFQISVLVRRTYYIPFVPFDSIYC